jgi:hypothetical protein
MKRLMPSIVNIATNDPMYNLENKNTQYPPLLSDSRSASVVNISSPLIRENNVSAASDGVLN